MTKTKIINETPFSPIPTSVIDDVVAASTGNPTQTATFDSNGIYDWNSQIADLGRPTISSNNFRTYLQDYEDPFGAIVSSGSAYSFIPSPASYTKGLVDDSDDFKHKFFPDYNDETGPDNLIRGRFKTQAEYDGQTTDPFAGGGYSEFTFKYSADGVGDPATKKIDNRYFGPDGTVTVVTNQNPETFGLPNWTPTVPVLTSSGGGFNPDPDSSDRGSGPTDDFTPPTTGGGDDGGDADATTPAPTPPATTTPAP
jgi:hypothetical protein